MTAENELKEKILKILLDNSKLLCYEKVRIEIDFNKSMKSAGVKIYYII